MPQGEEMSEQGCDFAGEKRECFFLVRLFQRRKMPYVWMSGVATREWLGGTPLPMQLGEARFC